MFSVITLLLQILTHICNITTYNYKFIITYYYMIITALIHHYYIIITSLSHNYYTLLRSLLLLC